MKTWNFYGLLILFVVSVVETISFSGLHLLERSKPGTVVDLFLSNIFQNQVTPTTIQQFAGGYYDRELGWVYHPHDHGTRKNPAGVEWSYSIDHRGARNGPGNEGPLLISTYGDSFTACVHVSNDETWQTYLAATVQDAVLNFGVPSYSILQAILRMERHFAKGLVSPLTVLAIFETDLGRSVTAYQPFNRPKDGLVLGFRPALRYRGKIEFFPNALKDTLSSPSQLEVLATNVAKYDYSGEKLVRLSFPFTSQIIRLFRERLIYGRTHSSEFWKTIEGQALATYLIDRFVQSTEKAGSRPVLLLLPEPQHLRQGTEPGYTRFKKEIRQRYPDMVVVVDIAEQNFIRDKFHVLPFKGHASAYGNRVIADALLRELRPIKELNLRKNP